MSDLLITDTWSFTKSFHKISITFNFRFFIFLALLANSFNFLFFDIPPCISRGCLCNFLISWRLLLMLVMPLFNNPWFLLETRTSRFFRHNPMLFYFFDYFCCFDKFFRKNAVLILRDRDRFLCFHLSDF